MGTVQINDEEFCRVYRAGYETWACLHSCATRRSLLPTYCFFTRYTFLQHPTFPPNLDLRYNDNEFFASGRSIWGSYPAECSHDLTSFQQLVHLQVSLRQPLSLSFSESVQSDCDYASCFASNGNYVSILILAWAYIVSARWVELMPTPCFLTYTESQAKDQDATSKDDKMQDFHVVDIGPAEPGEARWWAAVLARGQGWRATMSPSLWSPWSICLQSSPEFLLSPPVSTSPSPGSLPSSQDACSFLHKFCVRHNIIDQSHAALAAVLLFPSLGNSETLKIPTPRSSKREQLPGRSSSQQHDWIQGQQLDKFLTLSCHTQGIRPMLLSVFYNSSIECNAVTPWLQGTLAAIDSLTANDPFILGRMCMDRAPEVACLWLGSTILGQQRKLLQDIRYGQMPVNLHSAVWSGKIQSFIQEPVSAPVVAHSHVQRADECRLLFLSQSEYHTRAPVCQWRPFGSTPITDVEIEVRNHAQCKGHQLQYQGIAWNCNEGNSISPTLEPANVDVLHSHSNTQQSLDCASKHTVLWEAMERKEVISENATRSILGWLRIEGHAPHERELWKHEWLDVSESDDDDCPGEMSSATSLMRPSQVERWLSSCIELH